MSVCFLKLSRLQFLAVTKRPLGIMFLSDKGGRGGGDDDNKRASAKTKLNALLQSIIKEGDQTSIKAESENEETVQFKLAKPLDENKIRETKRAKNKDARSKIDEEAGESISQTLLKAVKNVAETIPGDSQVVESELVQKLKTQNNSKVNLSDIFAGMKIDKTKKAADDRSTGQSQGIMETSRAERVRRILEQRRPQQFDKSGGEWSNRRRDNFQRERRKPELQGYSRTDIFGYPPLGIFSVKPKEPPQGVPVLSTWDRLHQRELKLAVTHPPANGFEEMILLTEQGKLWKFPIDNDQGRDEEAKYAFHEHVFLEHLVEGWCPKKGPIRHFMELVCVALGQNAWLTVPEKHEHLEWYHQYFLSKAAILKEVGAGEIK